MAGVARHLRPPLLALAVVVAHVLPLNAQNPDTDIWVATLARVGDSLAIGEPRNVTSRAGYDNHPWFNADGTRIYYAADVDGQTDVFRLDLTSGETARVTSTPENEFSPMLLPGGELLAVRWAADMSDGHLWLFDAAGTPLRVHAGSVPRIGYYAWGDDGTLAVFVNDSVQSFVLSDAATGAQTRIGQGLNGSPPRRIPGERAVSYMQRDAAGAWWIWRLDLDTRAGAPLVRALEGGASNYFWTPDGVLLMARGDELHAWDPRVGGEWRRIAKFERPGLRAITRFAISPAGDRIALVSLSEEAWQRQQEARRQQP